MLQKKNYFLKAYNVLADKFGEDGYAKFYFKDTQYEKFLKVPRPIRAYGY